MPYRDPDRERASQAAIMRQKRALDRDIQPRRVVDPARRAACEHDDPRFLKEYLGRVFYNPFTSAQEQFIEECGRALRYGTSKAQAAPRGSGKSSVVKYLALKYSLYRQLRFPLIIAATTTKAQKSLKDIKRKLSQQTNVALFEDFPFETDLAKYVRGSAARCNNVTWGGQEVHMQWSPDAVILPSLPEWDGGLDQEEYGLPPDPSELGPIVMSLGFTSDDLQGCNVMDVRPDFVMLDDLDSRDSMAAEHGVIAEKIEDCIDKTVAGLGGPNRRLGRVFTCTITSRRSAAYRYTDRDQKPAWEGDRTPRILSWPDRKDLWENWIDKRERDPSGREAYDYLRENFDAMHEGAELANPHDFNSEPNERGEPTELSALHRCYEYIFTNGMDSFQTEHQNDPPADEDKLQVQVTPSHILRCIGGLGRLQVMPDSDMICRGVDIRKIEIHTLAIARGLERPHTLADYNVHGHGTTETTVEQAETLILDNLHKIADEWQEKPFIDTDGTPRQADLTLIDKGWVGNWTEDGQVKTWATQPVETFCMERGLRRFLPAKGAPRYQSPQPSDSCVVGNNWHMNRGEGKARRCTEVIWNADHWHALVEELFLLPDDDRDRIRLFASEGGLYRNHRAFGDHIREGAERFKADLNRGAKTYKPRYVRDHWYDSLAMALVAQSVEQWMRDNLTVRKRVPHRVRRPVRSAGIGAR